MARSVPPTVGKNEMQFRGRQGPIPESHFDNEVPVKKNPDNCYAAEFVERNATRLKALKDNCRHSAG
jgi:hypothetical protein